MTWTHSLEAEVAVRVRQVVRQSAVQAVIDGTLNRRRFACFLAQDALYLNAFKGSMVMLAERLPAQERELLHRFAYSSVKEERLIQQRMIELFGIEMVSVVESPVTEEYIALERSMCLSMSVEAALAVLLPCFWLYFEIMKAVNRSIVRPDNPYRYWTAAYSDPSFEEDTAMYRALCDRYAEMSDAGMRDRMQRVFCLAADMEMSFWNTI